LEFQQGLEVSMVHDIRNEFGEQPLIAPSPLRPNAQDWEIREHRGHVRRYERAVKAREQRHRRIAEIGSTAYWAEVFAAFDNRRRTRATRRTASSN
jgi:hypothetical protein